MKHTKSHRFLIKLALGVCAALVALAGPLQLGGSAFADQYDEQMAALQQQIDQYQAKANDLHKQANSLQAAIGALTAEKNSIEAQLNLSQARYDKLTADIAANQKKLEENQQALGDIIANLYVDSDITPLEMLASSDNVGDFLDKQEYRSAASEKLKSTIDAVTTLKKKLESDKQEVSKVLEQQKGQRASLVAKEQQKQQLLSSTQGKEASYQKQVSDTKAQLASIAAQQREALARVTGGTNYGSVGAFQFRNYSGNMGCSGGYPYCGGLDSSTDPWGLYTQECVSYAAWSAYSRFGKYVTNFSGGGNAYQWPSSAPSLMGATVDHTPAVGSVAILPSTPGFAPIGHAMVVESIEGGGWVHVSQFNFGGTGEYSTMDIQASGVLFVHFQNR